MRIEALASLLKKARRELENAKALKDVEDNTIYNRFRLRQEGELKTDDYI